MNKKFMILGISLMLVGCTCPLTGKKAIVAKVNNYDISAEEFETEFMNSPYGRQDTLESRKDFLNNLIDRKLVLQEAQKEGLDKENSFLKSIERFWEQSLLKVALDKKTQEIAGSVKITDKEIEQTYQQLLKDGKISKPYAQAYNEIKWRLLKALQSRRMNEWLVSLRKDAKVEVNYGLLNNK